MIDIESNVVSEKKTNSRFENVINETLCTEDSFGKDLDSIVCFYEDFFNSFDSTHIFSSLKCCLLQLISFSKSLLQYFIENKSNPYSICNIFLDRWEDFGQYYGDYCELFPLANAILESTNKTSSLATLIENCRVKSKQLLPLSSYLLKPVQRILKYHLLLETLGSDKSLDQSVHEIAQKAIKKMKQVADTINEKQRFQQGYAQLAILRKKITNLMEPLPVSIVGPVLIQEKLLVNNKWKQVILFENILMIAYISENETYIVKDALTNDVLVLSEYYSKDQLVFKIYDQKKPKNYYNIKAKNEKDKQTWIFYIKRLVLNQYDLKINKEKLSGLLGQEDANKLMCMNSVFNLQNIEKTLRNMDSSTDAAKEESSTLKMGSRMGINNIVAKIKKFNLGAIIAGSESLTSKMKNEPTEPKESHKESVKAVQTAADVIELINTNKEAGAENINLPWNKDFFDNAAKEISTILHEDSDKIPIKSNESIFGSNNSRESIINDKQFIRITSMLTPKPISSVPQFSQGMPCRSESINVKYENTKKSSLVELQRFKSNVNEIKIHGRKRSDGQLIPYSSVETHLDDKKNLLKVSTPTVDNKTYLSVESPTSFDTNSTNSVYLSSAEYLGSISPLGSSFSSQESNDTFENDAAKMNIPSTPSTKVDAIPDNIVESIAGVINTNYNNSSNNATSDAQNRIAISKASRIGNILLKLQQDYMSSQEKFKCKAEPIKIGKMAFTLDELFDQNNEEDKTHE